MDGSNDLTRKITRACNQLVSRMGLQKDHVARKASVAILALYCCSFFPVSLNAWGYSGIESVNQGRERHTPTNREIGKLLYELDLRDRAIEHGNSVGWDRERLRQDRDAAHDNLRQKYDYLEERWNNVTNVDLRGTATRIAAEVIYPSNGTRNMRDALVQGMVVDGVRHVGQSLNDLRHGCNDVHEACYAGEVAQRAYDMSKNRIE